VQEIQHTQRATPNKRTKSKEKTKMGGRGYKTVWKCKTWKTHKTM